MGKVTVQSETTVNPLTLMGKEAGICYGANVSNQERNYRRGLDCLNSGHMRTAEYPQVYLVLEGYSARVIRELYTHIAGGPTRLQASTRYINYQHFKYIIPPSIENNAEAYETKIPEFKLRSRNKKSRRSLTPRIIVDLPEAFAPTKIQPFNTPLSATFCGSMV